MDKTQKVLAELLTLIQKDEIVTLKILSKKLKMTEKTVKKIVEENEDFKEIINNHNLLITLFFHN